MLWKAAGRFALWLALAFLAQELSPQAKAQGGPNSSVKLFDTGTSSSVPLPGEALWKKAGWSRLPEDKTDREFTGDVVFSNDRLAVVLRRNGPGAEVYSRGTKGLCKRAVLAPGAGAPAVRLESVSVVENNPSAAAVDIAFKAPNGGRLGMRCELEVGQVFVKTEARGGVRGLRIEAPCRFVVLPDFFADDIVVDATEIPVAAAELPSENFLLHMLGDGDAIVMSVSNDREQDMVISLSGEGSQRIINRSEVQYGKDGKIWVAVLEGRGVWHHREIAAEDAGRTLPLDWKAAHPAQWRVDWRRDDKLTDSWEMIAQKSNGTFEKHGWFGSPTMIPKNRSRWTTVLGRFAYPCWVDRSGQGYLQPLKRVARFQGPALIYPINRVQATPLNVFTVVDIVQATLGVGPCEYILDVEGQGAAMKGRATCAARDTLNPIYAAKQQKQRRAEIEQALTDVMVFVKHIRGRIDDYVAFGHEMLAYLDQQQKARPELAEFLDEMEALTRVIDARVEKRKEKIRSPEYVAGLIRRFRNTLMDYEGDDALAKCKAITGAIVTVGGDQDELVGECRMAVKVLRQQAGLAMATDPRVAEVAKEIRRRTQRILRNPTSYEAPRH